MRNGKTRQECNPAESRAGRLGGAGKTDSFLSLSLSVYVSVSMCLTFCLCLSYLPIPFLFNSVFFNSLSLFAFPSLRLSFLASSCCFLCLSFSVLLSLFLSFHLVRACLEFNSLVRSLQMPTWSQRHAINTTSTVSFLSVFPKASGCVGPYWHSVLRLFCLVAFTV